MNFKNLFGLNFRVIVLLVICAAVLNNLQFYLGNIYDMYNDQDNLSNN